MPPIKALPEENNQTHEKRTLKEQLLRNESIRKIDRRHFNSFYLLFRSEGWKLTISQQDSMLTSRTNELS